MAQHYHVGDTSEIRNDKMSTMMQLSESIIERYRTLTMYSMFSQGKDTPYISTSIEIDVPYKEDYALLPRSEEQTSYGVNDRIIRLNSIENITPGTILEITATCEQLYVVAVDMSRQELTVDRGFAGTMQSEVNLLDYIGVTKAGFAVEEYSGPGGSFYSDSVFLTNIANITRSDDSLSNSKYRLAENIGDSRFSHNNRTQRLWLDYYAKVEHSAVHSRYYEGKKNSRSLRTTRGLIEQCNYNGFVPPAGAISPDFVDYMLWRNNRFTHKNSYSETMSTMFGDEAFIANFKRVLEASTRYRTEIVNIIPKYGVTGQVMITPFGELQLVPTHVFSPGNSPSTSAMILKPENVVINHFRQPKYVAEPEGVNALDGKQDYIVGEWIVNNLSPFTSAIIDNVIGWGSDEDYFDQPASIRGLQA